MIYGEGGEASKSEYNYDAVKRFWINNLERSKIGMITDCGTVNADIAHHNGDITAVDEYLCYIRVFQGQEIDAAKTGMHPEVPRSFFSKYVPHWVESMRPYRDYSKKEIYHSVSPIGQLHDFIIEYLKDFRLKKCDETNMSYLFGKNINIELFNKILPYVKELEKSYRRDLSYIQEQSNNNTFTKDENYLEINNLMSEYTDLIHSIDPDIATVAACCYHVTYSNSSSLSYSFPWVTAFDGLIELLYRHNNNCKLMKISKEKYTAGDVFEYNFNNTLYELEAFNLNDKLYLRIPTEEIKVEEQTITFDKIKFIMSGFTYYGFNAISVVDYIKNNNKIIDVIVINEKISLICNNKVIGVLPKNDSIKYFHLIGKKVKLTSYQKDIVYINKKTNTEQLRKAFSITGDIIGESDNYNIESLNTALIANAIN